jgi:hypothetical protein
VGSCNAADASAFDGALALTEIDGSGGSEDDGECNRRGTIPGMKGDKGVVDESTFETAIGLHDLHPLFLREVGRYESTAPEFPWSSSSSSES